MLALVGLGHAGRLWGGREGGKLDTTPPASERSDDVNESSFALRSIKPRYPTGWRGCADVALAHRARKPSFSSLHLVRSAAFVIGGL